MKNMNRQRIEKMLERLKENVKENVKERAKERVKKGKRILFLFRKKTGVSFIAAFLFFPLSFGFLGGFSAIAVSRTFFSPPKIASINMKKILSSYIDQNVNRNSNQNGNQPILSNQELSRRSKQFIQILESEVRRFSKEKNTLLLLSDVMVSGNRDVTPLIQRRVNQQFLISLQHKERGANGAEDNGNKRNKRNERNEQNERNKRIEVQNQAVQAKEVDYAKYS